MMKIKKSDLIKIVQEACADIPELPPTGRNLDYDNPEEGSHAKGHLYHISSDAMSLHDQLLDDDEIPAWCLEYLAIARHGVGIVRDFLVRKIKNQE